MKMIKIFFLCILTQSVFAQQALELHENGLAAALAQSKTENKLVFFMCYASWCTHCKYMKENVLTVPSVGTFYNKNFICYGQDMEHGEGRSLHEQFKINSYPTFLFLDSTGTVVYRMTGEFKPEELIGEGKMAMIPRRQLPYLKRQFESDTSNSEKCYDYLRLLKKGGLDYSDMLKKYFSTQSDQDLLSEVNWRIISNGVQDINSKEFQFVLNHKKEFVALTSAERVERKIVHLVKGMLQPFAEGQDSVHYFQNRISAAAIHAYNIDSLIFTYDVVFYERTKNYVQYKATTLQNTSKYAWNNATQLKNIAVMYLKHSGDSSALKVAVTWAQRSIDLNPEFQTYLLCAKLYKKANDKQAAIQTVERGKAFAMKLGWDYSDADKLLLEWQ